MMRVLACSSGDGPDDFAHTVSGEIAVPAYECDRPGHDCTVAWSGIATGRSTTVVRVVSRPDINVETLLEMVRAYLATAGEYEGVDEDAAALVESVVDITDHFAVGDQLRRHRDGEDEVVEAIETPRKRGRR